MIVYYSILAYLLYLGIVKKLSEKYDKSENIILIIASLVLFFFAAMRSIDIGADTRQYCSHFIKISETHWKDLPQYSNKYWGDIEWGFKILSKLLSVFKNQQTITIVHSILQIGLISIIVFKQSSNKWLSIFLYFTLCFYQTALNLTPSSFVSYFIFLSFPFIKDRRIIPFLLFIAIGMFFHTSAIFFIPLFFLYKIPVNKKVFIIVLFGTIMLFLFYPIFINIISLIIPNKYIGYIDGSKEHMGNTVELIVLFVQIVGVFFCLLLIDKNDRNKIIRNNQLVFWILMYETILYLLSIKSSMFQRGAFLFSPYIIIIIPNIINQIKVERRKFIAIAGIIVYGISLYFLRVNVNNVGTTMPYKFFFND